LVCTLLVDNGSPSNIAVYFPTPSFPLNEDTSHGTTPSFLEPSTSHHTLSAIEQLPFEVIVYIASSCPLPSALSLSSTSRHLRSNTSVHPRTGITLHVCGSRRAHLGMKVIFRRFTFAKELTQRWHAIAKKSASGSMMNRKRIWGIAQQLE
jgi:hypothetical protein